MNRLISFLLMMTAMAITAGVIFLVPSLAEVFDALYSKMEEQLPYLTDLSLRFSQSTVTKVIVAVLVFFSLLFVEILMPSRTVACLFHLVILWLGIALLFVSITSYTLPFLNKLEQPQVEKAQP